MPQHTAPQPSLLVGPTASHESPAPHAELGPHWQVPFTQRSPAPQHSAPHTGPSGHPLDAPHDAGLASTPPSAQPSSVQVAPSAVQVHELQPSPAGKTSSIA
jgi:hypothetical protein